MALMRSALVTALASVVLLVAHPARADEGQISFCNEFPHTLYIAIAYEEYEDNYISRGWLEVENGKCYVFDTAIRVKSFYYHAESESYREGKHRVKMLWGKDRKFAVRDANFQSYNADKAYSGMRLAGFTLGAESTSGPLTAIVTFTETGATIATPARDQPAAQAGVGASPQTAPQPQAEQAATPAAQSASGGIEDKPTVSTPSSANAPSSDDMGSGHDSARRQ
jgi:uncharacterized membrane protein